MGCTDILRVGGRSRVPDWGIREPLVFGRWIGLAYSSLSSAGLPWYKRLFYREASDVQEVPHQLSAAFSVGISAHASSCSKTPATADSGVVGNSKDSTRWP